MQGEEEARGSISTPEAFRQYILSMSDAILREQLIKHMKGHGAHISFDNVVSGFPVELIGKRIENLPHTAWQIVYHLWIAQWDILEFSRDPSHKSPAWPAEYWPAEARPKSAALWGETLAKFRADLKAMIGLVQDSRNDMFAPFPHGDGQNLLREALLVIDHNSYHLGQLVEVRRMLGAWPENA